MSCFTDMPLSHTNRFVGRYSSVPVFTKWAKTLRIHMANSYFLYILYIIIKREYYTRMHVARSFFGFRRISGLRYFCFSTGIVFLGIGRLPKKLFVNFRDASAVVYVSRETLLIFYALCTHSKFTRIIISCTTVFEFRK